ncbi:MAG TPA: hypothetical protein VMN36_04045 [Verrucomicrobiales bacterium]|nr:hypothetical protein [Verrucomicrobiales bacterium]
MPTETRVRQNAALQVPASARVLAVPLVFIAALAAFTLLPRVHANPNLLHAFAGAAVLLAVWLAVLLGSALRGGRRLRLEFFAAKNHYIQLCMHSCIYTYWSFYWPEVRQAAPLILGQIAFLYAFDALLSWSRRDIWRFGFGAFPIVFSTNLFLWFRDDAFHFQFLMIAAGALGKEFIRWQRDGRSTHIFNPSAFSLSLFSVILLLTSSTGLTWGEDIATTLGRAPYMYVLIFLAGLVVQYFFSVTLMTLFAAASLWIANGVYTAATGSYHFIDSNIPIAVFLGLHLLVTDPSTSPRSLVGRAIFGCLYGLSVFAFYALLAQLELPRFYDKLLPVPLLNLSVIALDRLASRGWFGKISALAARSNPQRLNLAHMAVWIAVFLTMLSTGFVLKPHPGGELEFWRQAIREGKPRAAENLLIALQHHCALGSGNACNELGLLYAGGKVVEPDPALAAAAFGEAARLGHIGGAQNLAIQYLYEGRTLREADALAALDLLEHSTSAARDGRSAYLMGFAYEHGRGRTPDKLRAVELYERGCEDGNVDACKNAARMRTRGEGVPVDFSAAARALQKATDLGDAYATMHLASLYHSGQGVPADEQRALELLRRACELGAPEACAALEKLDLD